MNENLNILIPGGGGFAAVCTIKSLRMVDYKGTLVATDADPLSAGFYLADKYYVVPYASDPKFLKAAVDIIKKEKVNLILPTSGFDIVPYSKNKKRFENSGVIVAMSDYETIRTCMNKIEFYNKLKYEFDLPYSTTNPSEVKRFPVFIKPIFGKGSRNIFRCCDDKELDYLLTKMKNEEVIIQEYLPGKEYTIDVLSDLEGNALFAVPRERISVKGGVSFKGRIVLNKKIQNECLRAAEYLKIKGPSCMQMKMDKDGEPKFVEINPRMGGGTIMATFAGANFPDLIVKLAIGKKIKIPKIKEVTVLRYYEEIVLEG